MGLAGAALPILILAALNFLVFGLWVRYGAGERRSRDKWTLYVILIFVALVILAASLPINTLISNIAAGATILFPIISMLVPALHKKYYSR